MKAVQIIARGEPVFVDAPKPELRPGHALVKTLRLSLCGSDIRHLHYLRDDQYPTGPGDTGHEMVGRVEAIDGGDFQVGDIVLALAPDHGAMADYYLAPVENLLALDPSLPLEHAVQAQQLGTVLYASQALPDVRDKSVAVIGQGSAGLWFNTVLRERGARRIIALDRKAYRLNYSKHFGATHTIHNQSVEPVEALKAICGGALPDVVIEAAGEAESIALAPLITRRYGFILFFGCPRVQSADFPIYEFFWRNFTTRSVVGAIEDPGHACTKKALEWIGNGVADAAGMITHVFGFDDVFEAYELHHLQDEGAVKIVVDMEG